MKTEWDYTGLADAYLKRPDYSIDALQKIWDICGLNSKMIACDVGAGVAHLTLHLLHWGMDVTAIEPNDAMRKNGMIRTHAFNNVKWVEAVSERTLQEDNSFDFVSFGSSFNVADRQKTLAETYRILKPGGWFTCMWNHRDLTDPLQKEIEAIFHETIPNYNYGTRREDQTQVIENSGLFIEIQAIEGVVLHTMTRAEIIEAWRSHATLERQAGELFSHVISKIEVLLESQPDKVQVPYVTRAWVARRKD